VVYALYIPYLGRLQARLTPAVASAYVCVGTALYFLVGSGGAVQGALAPHAWTAIGVLAVFCTVLAFLAFMRGLARLGPVRAAIVSTVEPLWTARWARWCCASR
jgi:drug/metabolite transporter (DMT)-like permease